MKYKNIILSLFTTLLLTSCMFTEELYINKDGSGSYAFKMDMSKMMEAMGSMNPKDSLKEPEKIDTLIYFKDILEENKDSIKNLSAEDREVLEALEEFTIRMHVDEEANRMQMDFGLEFEDLAELKNMEEKISKIQALNEKKNKEEPVPSKADVTYQLKGKSFKRLVNLKDLSEEELNSIDKSLEQSAAFLEGSMYTLIYHFEQKIKSVSLENAVISEDGKTLTLEMPMDTLVKNPELLDFEVKLK